MNAALRGFSMFAVVLTTAACVAPQQRDPNTDPTLIRLKSLEARLQRVEQNVGIAAPQEASKGRVVTIGEVGATTPEPLEQSQPLKANAEPAVVVTPPEAALNPEELRKQRLQSALAEQQAAISRLRDEIERRRISQQQPPTLPLAVPQPLSQPVSAPEPITEILPAIIPSEPEITEAAAPAIEMGGERDRYRSAYALLQQGESAQAQQRFLDFIQSYPNSDYADNAQYWLAESYYGARDFDNARLEFSKVEQNYPNSSKVSDAQLKIAYIFYEKQQYPEARTRLEEVMSRYVGSRAARLAEDRLLLMNVQGI